MATSGWRWGGSEMSTTSMSGDETRSSHDENTRPIPNFEAADSAAARVLFHTPARRNPAFAYAGRWEPRTIPPHPMIPIR